MEMYNVAMTNTTSKNTQTLLSERNGMLGKILETSQQIQAIDTQVKAHLPEALRAHCHVCNIKNGQLILATDSAHWLTRLKFEKSELLSQLRQQPGFEYLSGIHCKVAPKLAEQTVIKPRKPKAHFLSKAGNQALKSIKKILNLK